MTDDHIISIIVEHKIGVLDVALTFVNHRIKTLRSKLASALSDLNESRDIGESLALLPNVMRKTTVGDINSRADALRYRIVTYKQFHDISEEMDWLYEMRSTEVDFTAICNRYGAKNVIDAYADIKANSIKSLINRYNGTIGFWKKELQLHSRHNMDYPLLGLDGTLTTSEIIIAYVDDIHNRISKLSEYRESVFKLKNEVGGTNVSQEN